MPQNNIPEVEVVKNERINISIWLVPIIALLISLWLAYQYFSQLGPEITIEFKSSSGLKAKQSQIRFRDVPVGTVTNISLKRGGQSVIVTARLNKDAQQFLNINSKFWIVKPKIDKTGITGLETLVSGSYIQLDSTLGGTFKNRFKGLEEPYLDEENIKGKYFKLNAPNSYNLESGSLVFYRNINVGDIKQVKLSKDGNFVEFNIFVKEPYYKFINTKTQFWKMSNFKLDVSKATLDLSLASSSQILYGGISFSKPSKLAKKYPIKRGYIFPLFASSTEAKEKKIGYNTANLKTYQMNFSQTLGTLKIGAPVKFQDFQVGHVVDIESKFNPKMKKIVSNILVDIDTTIFIDDNNSKDFKNFIAKLTKNNLLLDTLHIELTYKEGATIASAKPYDIFPTKNIMFDDMSKQFKTVLSSIKNLIDDNKKPLNDTLNNLNNAIKNINTITTTKEIKELPAQLKSSLQELQNTLKSTQSLISSESKMSDDISESMKEVNKASKSLERVLRKIDEKPNSLIFGD